MKNIEQFFKLGMKRDIGVLSDPSTSYLKHYDEINLGCGAHVIENARCLDYPEYNFDTDGLPFNNESISAIHAYHLLEHLENPLKLLQEAQRVLRKGGAMNICVPYYTSNLYASDLDHKHSFTEKTFSNLLNEKYYNKNKIEWEFKINMSLIIGIEERCLALLVQLEKI